MSNVIIKLRKCPPRYAYGYFEPKLFPEFETHLWGIANQPKKLYDEDMDNVIDGQFTGDIRDLARSVENIKNRNDEVDEVVLITLTKEDRILIFHTCEDDRLTEELLLDGLNAVKPEIFLDLDEDE